MSNDMYYILAYSLIAVLCGCLVCCGYQLRKELKKRSDERTEARRAFYRYKAYKDMNERYDLKTSREKLWKSLQK